MGDTSKIVRGSKVDTVVMPYQPKTFPIQISAEAKAFVAGQIDGKSEFVISHLVSDSVGITDIHRDTLEGAIREEALNKLKDVQERAYKEAYELGIIEGTEKAFGEKKIEFDDRLRQLDELLGKMSRVLSLVVEEKEAQLIKLIHSISSKIALREISLKPEMIVDLVKKVVDDIQTEDKIMIKISNEDKMFLESLAEKAKHESSKFQNVAFETSDDVSQGGCILETNHGLIDASIEQRVQKAWEALAAKLPVKKDDYRVD